MQAANFKVTVNKLNGAAITVDTNGQMTAEQLRGAVAERVGVSSTTFSLMFAGDDLMESNRRHKTVEELGISAGVIMHMIAIVDGGCLAR